MPDHPLTTDDYPLSEKSPERVAGLRGRSLETLSLEAVLDGGAEMEDFRIAPTALLQQAEIAGAAGRPALAANFRRASEMTRVPREMIMEIYELLRPGRARSIESLHEIARRLELELSAPLLAQLVREAASTYEKRGLFNTRY